MKKVKLTKQEETLISSSPIEKAPLTKDFLLQILKDNSSLCEIHKKEEMVTAIYEGFQNRSVQLFGKQYKQEKWFCDNDNGSGEKIVKKGYLSNYENGVLIFCTFTGIQNQIKDVIMTYSFTDFNKTTKPYPQEEEKLIYEDESLPEYKISKPKKK